MSTLIKMLIGVIGAAIAVSIFMVPYLNQLTAIQHRSEIKISNQIIIADVVSSDADKAKGLGGRESIGINEGMLFLFDSPDKYGVWMKDMKFPIDIIWIAHGQVVGFKENVDPQIGADLSQLKIYYPPEPVDRVLELKAGRAGLLKTEIGDLVKVRPLLSAQAASQ